MPLDASQPIEVRIAHAASGRVRLRLGQRLEAAAFDALADRLAASPGIRRIVVRPATGSVIIEAATDEAGLLRMVEGLDFIKVLPPE
jgi:hypothetical protein